MEGIEVIKIERHKTNEKFVTKFEGDVEKVVLHKFWDSHGMEIPEGTETFTKCHIRLVEHSWKEFGTKWQIMEAFVDGQPLDVELTSVRGDTKLLKLKGCVGAG